MATNTIDQQGVMGDIKYVMGSWSGTTALSVDALPSATNIIDTGLKVVRHFDFTLTTTNTSAISTIIIVDSMPVVAVTTTLSATITLDGILSSSSQTGDWMAWGD